MTVTTWSLALVLAALALVGALYAGLSDGPHWDLVEGGLPGLSPFTAVRWRGDVPEVEVDGRFYELVSIDELSAADLVAFCRESYDTRWRKRFSEDLVEVLARRGRPAIVSVDLALRDLETGRLFVRRRVALTSENRRSVWWANRAGEVGARSAPR